jgi:hypothetical protein
VTAEELAAENDRLRAALERLRPSSENQRALVAELRPHLDSQDLIQLASRLGRILLQITWQRAGQAMSFERRGEWCRRARQRLGEARVELEQLAGLGLGVVARGQIEAAAAFVAEAQALLDRADLFRKAG